MKTLLILAVYFVCYYSYSQHSSVKFIEKHLTEITKTNEFRNYKNVKQLNNTAAYISSEFKKYSNKVSYQEFNVEENSYKNIICSFGTDDKERIIIGAHYDVCGNQQGADDNASGVVGLLELARLLKNQKLKCRIDLVAFTLEEPPFFRTNNMGSYIHAKSLKENNTPVKGMISLEMIGYFSDEPYSQNYPILNMDKIYGNKGDFITLVNKSNKGIFAKKFCDQFVEEATIKTVVFDNTASLESVEFSDHLNYWNFGFDALMITDTSFLRNKNYHRKSDTLETLNLPKMAKVIDSVFETLITMK